MDLPQLTLASSAVLAACLLVLERVPGLRLADVTVRYRWFTNVGLFLLGSLLIGMFFPVGLDAIARELDAGLLRQLPLALEVVLVFLLLDLWRYWEHRALHEIPLLWRFHLVHHSDTAMDVTTSQRHHPLEAIFTAVLGYLLLFALGFSPESLGIYMLAAMLSSIYTHLNLRLPASLDSVLRPWLVTPSVHAIHHSSLQSQTDSNYGAVFTVWDRLFGTYSDPSRTAIPRFGLDCFRDAEDAALGPVLLQPFEYRDGAQPATPEGHSRSREEPAPVALSAAWRQAIWYGGTGLALTLLAFWPTLTELAGLWSGVESYQYAWLVAPTFAYVMWYRRAEILALVPRPGYAGMFVVAVAGVLWLAAGLVDIRVGQHLALVLALQGVAMCAIGFSLYRRLFPAMALLFFMVPCGDIFQPLLRDLTVTWIEWFALLCGLPCEVEGYVLQIGAHRYVVVEACSGLTFFTLASFLGYSFGLLLYRSLFRVLVMAVLGAALGVLTNALRVWLIVGIDWFSGSQMDMGAHSDIQGLVLLLSMAALIHLASRLDHEDADAAIPQRLSNGYEGAAIGARLAPVLSGVVLLVAGIVGHLGMRPDAASNDQGVLQRLATTYPESRRLETPGSGQSVLEIAWAPGVEVVLLEAANGGARLQETALGPADRAWRNVASSRYRDCSGDDCFDFVHKTFRRKGSDHLQHAIYTYFVSDFVTASRLEFRLASGWQHFARGGSGNGLIGFRLDGIAPAELELGAVFSQFHAIMNSTAPDGPPAHRIAGSAPAPQVLLPESNW